MSAGAGGGVAIARPRRCRPGSSAGAPAGAPSAVGGAERVGTSPPTRRVLRRGADDERGGCRPRTAADTTVAANRMPAHGRPDEAVADRPRPSVLPAVRHLQQVRRRHDRRQQRLGRVVEQRLVDAEQEGHDVEAPDAGRAGRRRDGDDRAQRTPDQIHRHHEHAPIDPVDDGAGGEGEHEPGKPRRRRQPGDQTGVAGQRGGQERQGGLVDAVAQVRDRAGCPEAPVGYGTSGARSRFNGLMPVLSVLDLAPVGEGSHPGRRPGQLARPRPRPSSALGYRRYWVAEHHNMPGIASSSPAVLLAHVAAATSTHPGRLGRGDAAQPRRRWWWPSSSACSRRCTRAAIDLGIGRAPGTDPVTARRPAPRRADARRPTTSPSQLGELLGFFDGPFPDGHPYRADHRRARASATGRPSGCSARATTAPRWPGCSGLPFSFAHHFAAGGTDAGGGRLPGRASARRPSSTRPTSCSAWP